MLEANRYPMREYQAILMLTPHGLYEDMVSDDTIERVMLAFDGTQSILDIAERLEVSFERVADFAKRFEDKGLVSMVDGPHRA